MLLAEFPTHSLVLIGWLFDWGQIGEGIASLWLAMGCSLVLGSMTGFNQVALFVFSLLAWWGRPIGSVARLLALPFEIYYCLLAPIAYLLILTRSSGDAELFIDAQPSILDPLAAVLILGMWSLRLLPSLVRVRWVRAGLLVCMVVLVTYGVKDLWQCYVSPPYVRGHLSTLENMGWFSGIASLYLIPLVIILGYLRRQRRDGQSVDPGGFYCLPKGLGLPIFIVGYSVVGVVWFSLGYHPSDSQSRQMLRQHRGTIVRASERHDLAPETLGALIYVIQREQASPMGRRLESAMMQAWLVDATSHLLLSEALDLSIGLAQIKPVTAQTALRLVLGSRDQVAVQPWPKQYRDVPQLGSRWILSEVWGQACELPVDGLPPKQEWVTHLEEEPTSIQIAALILDLYATQWEESQEGWSIRGRPEILATLYQLGFERSFPKPDPRSSPFGDRVAEVATSQWLLDLLSHELGG